MPSPQGQSASGRSAQSTFQLPLRVLNALTISMEVFLRRDFGSRYMDFQAALAVVLLIVYANLWQHEDVRPVYLFLFAYLFACAMHRLKNLRRMWRGQRDSGHSNYNGVPVLMRNFPRYSERTIKRVIEPVFVFIVGGIICQINMPLGWYLILGAASLFITSGLSDTLERVRAQELNDSLIEQQCIAERFRDMRGDR